MTVYEQYKKLKLDTSWIGLEKGPARGGYFCTPIGAKVFGWEGCGGIHYCFLKDFGEMVFAVDPENADQNVYPLAENFTDFLRMLLFAKHTAAVEQIILWDEEQFLKFLASPENQVQPEQQAVLDTLAEKLELSPMENTFAEVKRVQAAFDTSRLRFKPEYYDCKGIDPPERKRKKVKAPAAAFSTVVISAKRRAPSFPEGIRWLFFDVGSTLVDESRAYDRRIRETITGSGVSYEQFYEEMLRFYRQNQKGDLEAAKKFGLTVPPWHSEEERPYPDAVSCLKALQSRFSIGIIANQPLGTADRMEKMGLAPYLDRIVSSAEEGVAKPDPAIFRIALERAGCRPEQAVMIGDRLDNDIAPAKRLGMKTIWVKQGFGGLSTPRTPEETPDFTVGNLSELCSLILS